jgi:hypothetical protein
VDSEKNKKKDFFFITGLLPPPPLSGVYGRETLHTPVVVAASGSRKNY